MRIIGGAMGGRKIIPPSSMPETRPTTDVAKEALFNIIENNLDVSLLNVLDLFSGTGSISYEFASRGAKSITSVEKDTRMHNFIKKTALQFGMGNILPVKTEVFKFIEQCGEKFDFIFAGPPYALAQIDDLPVKLFERRLLKNKGWFVLEHTPRNDYKKFSFYKTERKYGSTVFSIFIETRE